MQEFDPVRHVLEHVPPEESDVAYFEKQVIFHFSLHFSLLLIHSYFTFFFLLEISQPLFVWLVWFCFYSLMGHLDVLWKL